MTFDRIKKLMIENFELKDEVLKPEASLEGLGLDSLDKIEFIFALENEFGVRIPEREVKINTIQDIVESMDKLMSEQKAKA